MQTGNHILNFSIITEQEKRSAAASSFVCHRLWINMKHFQCSSGVFFCQPTLHPSREMMSSLSFFAVSVFTGLVCRGVHGLAVLSHGVQLFDEVGREQSRLAVQVAVPPALFDLQTGRRKMYWCIVSTCLSFPSYPQIVNSHTNSNPTLLTIWF